MNEPAGEATAASAPIRNPRRFARWKVLSTAAAVVVVALFAWQLTRPSKSTPALTQGDVTKTAKSVVDKALKQAASQPAQSVLVYQTILPSIVFIETQGDGSEDNVEGTGGLGTGVVINADGSILTANHVIANATSIRVTFADGTTGVATVVSQEPNNDIAVLKADQSPEVLVPAVLGGGVRIGDETFAVGNPLGLVASLTSGVISGLDRSIPTPDGGRLEGLIQFDAAVNPGSSGGPLLNRNGQVVGIVTALANPSSENSFVGIGFAVPIATAGGGAAGAPPQ